MSQVFMPFNRQMRELVVTKAHLLDEDRAPHCLLVLCAHVAAYEAIMTQWENGDFSQHASTINFPSYEVRTYAVQGYERAKNKQKSLLASRPVLAKN
jgi:hypothetical protein